MCVWWFLKIANVKTVYVVPPLAERGLGGGKLGLIIKSQYYICFGSVANASVMYNVHVVCFLCCFSYLLDLCMSLA